MDATTSSGDAARRAPFGLRDARASDLEWIVRRHGELYREEYGWDERFEALVADVVRRFERDFDPARERAWIAEIDGRNAGCVLLVREPDAPDTARLRLLLVEPSARGLGLGRALVRECTSFARAAGYRRIVLWTNDVLTSARRIYEAEGYTLVREEPHALFGRALVGQTWALEL
jgi:GNAT superfamily N-acetyltransferase